MLNDVDVRLRSALLRGGKVRVDSREVREGDLFFGLPGEHFDGSQFAEKALEAGASVVAVRGEGFARGEKTIVSESPLQLLQEMARWKREQLRVPVIGITGSSGKTTTKELLVSALSTSMRVAATEGNLNNDIGVPLTVANFPQDLGIAVVEMGASHIGDIAKLCDIAEPTHGLITSVGKAHLEGFGDIEGVMRGKGELFAYIKRTGGVTFTRKDDERVFEMAKRIHLGCMSVGYSLAEYGTEITHDVDSGLLGVSVSIGGTRYTVRTQLVGDYNAINIVAALHVAYYFNVPVQKACDAIEAYVPSNHRSQLIRTERNSVVADCYNANPSSMLAALDSFVQRKAAFRWAFLGEMREMGAASASVHSEIVKRAERLLDGNVFYVGAAFHGVSPAERWFRDAEELRLYLQRNPIERAEILVKGSHGVGLELVLGEL